MCYCRFDSKKCLETTAKANKQNFKKVKIMSDLEYANRLFESSVKLCAAVKKHKCLYDRNSVHKNAPPVCETAWQSVAKECNETVEYCKNRWKNLYRSFFQGLKRRGNPYYLHEYMDFLIESEEEGKTKSKRNTAEILNDETNSTFTNDEDLSQQERLMDTINVIDDDDEEGEGEGSDSHTTSADESNEGRRSRKYISADANMGGGVFIIDEIGEEANEADNRRRSSYKRTCKRGLDPELLGELDDEEPEEKRRRKTVVEGRKSGTELHDKSTDNGHLSNKKLVIRVDKIKLNKLAHDKNETIKDNKVKELKNEFNKQLNEAVSPSKNFMERTVYTTKMVDKSTITNVPKRTSGTQYELTPDILDYDETFLLTVKNQLKQMNARQKLNFKRKIFQSLLEVFDDNTDFPSSDEVIAVPLKPQPRVVNTTTGELRLMRELVALVQAAKNTPEIINAKEKVKTNPTATAPPTATALAAAAVQAAAASSKPLSKTPATAVEIQRLKNQTSPLSLSPALDDDDDDLQFSLDNIDDEDDIQLPRTWEEIQAKPSDGNKATVEENVMGLPRHVLQKVVRVSGAGGSTIVARDGDKKRIYRIYPKSANPNGNSLYVNKNASGVSSFFVTPQKKPNEAAATSHKSINNLPNISIRSFNKVTPNNTSGSAAAANATGNNSNSPNLNNKTPTNQQTSYKSQQQQQIGNRILSASTGYFKMVPSTKTTSSINNTTTTSTATLPTQGATASPTISKVISMAKSPMLPPSSNVSNKRTITARPHANPPQIIQRRFSVCGPIPANNSTNSPTAAPTATKSNNTPLTSSVSQIQISQPISLNTKAMTSTQNTNTTTFVTSVNNKSQMDSTSIEEDIKSNIITCNTAAKEPQTSVANKEVTMESKKTNPRQAEEIPILETAGTIGADVLDPLFVKPGPIKSEPIDD